MPTSVIAPELPEVEIGVEPQEDDIVIEDETPDSDIWTVKEKALLKASIQGYRDSPKRKKAAFIAKKVVPKIKDLWNGRYSKTSMAKDKEVKAEWAKKKKVRYHSELLATG